MTSTAKPIYVLNGPNLNLLGSREPDIYGATTLEEIETLMHDAGDALGLTIEFRQSNQEGELVDWIQEAGAKGAGLILNAAAYTHTSVAIGDAVAAIGVPVIEVHLSNIFAREEFRHHSYISAGAKGVICGFGALGYKMALSALGAANATDKNNEPDAG